MNDAAQIKEIIDFCDENNIDSYYELSAYAYGHENENWIALLRKRSSRFLIASYLSDKHKKSGTKYKLSRHEAMCKNFAAQSEYFAKKDREFLESIENSVT